jgi:hypothetical protein
MEPPSLSAEDRRAAQTLAADLRRVFGERLRSIVAYGLQHRAPAEDDGAVLHTLALVDRLTFDDLAACVPLASTWHRQGLAVPLILGRDEFERSLDAFPLEYGDIIAHHVLVAGPTPFDGAAVAADDVRRACEQQAKSHLIHLREGFLETTGKPERVTRLIAASARPFRVLLENIARLQGIEGDDVAAAAERQIGVSAGLVREVLATREAQGTIADPTALLSRYIATVERLWTYVDTWRER